MLEQTILPVRRSAGSYPLPGSRLLYSAGDPTYGPPYLTLAPEESGILLVLSMANRCDSPVFGLIHSIWRIICKDAGIWLMAGRIEAAGVSDGSN